LQAYLGVTTQTLTPAISAQLDLPVDTGAIVRQLAPGAPAQEAGIAPGDVIVRIGEQAIASTEDVGEALQSLSPGDTVGIAVVHADGGEALIDVTLAARPLPVEQG
jgi:S1-C subfamily serine protease